MISYNFSENTIFDIKKLKKDLMETGELSNKSDTSFSKQIINEYAGKTFEENIRSALEYYFCFKKIDKSPKIFIKKISYDNSKEIEIVQNEETTINIKDKKYKLLFDKSFDLIIKNEKNCILNKINSKLSNKETTETIKNTNITLKLFPYEEMEIDGFFKIKNFSVNQFNENEVEILYNNISKEEETNFQYLTIEAKLSPKRINELMKQIRKDNKYLKLINKKPAVILGFINSDDVKYKNHFNSLKNIKCVIYGIKHSKLCGKNIVQPIDWDTSKKVDDLKAEVSDLKAEVGDLKEKLDEIYNYVIEKKNEEKEQIGRKKEKKEKERKKKEKKEGKMEEDEEEELKEKMSEGKTKLKEEEEIEEVQEESEKSKLKKKKLKKKEKEQLLSKKMKRKCSEEEDE